MVPRRAIRRKGKGPQLFTAATGLPGKGILAFTVEWEPPPPACQRNCGKSGIFFPLSRMPRRSRAVLRRSGPGRSGGAPGSRLSPAGRARLGPGRRPGGPPDPDASRPDRLLDSGEGGRSSSGASTPFPAPASSTTQRRGTSPSWPTSGAHRRSSIFSTSASATRGPSSPRPLSGSRSSPSALVRGRSAARRHQLGALVHLDQDLVAR
jgi:hypothetical protein